ncbi:MAG: type IV pilus biogenesis/stability protein PilW [Gammaproteobacteria bacterium]|jgi:type IV pilus assembly protein PilF|nr:type IV pilus biogenesis/stability protein PilW [Gammaproteobacteria bacterium]
MKNTWALLAVSLLVSACVSDAPKSGKGAKQMEQDAAEYNLQLGVGYLRQGEYQLALDKLNKSLEQNPSLAETHMALGYLYEQTNQPADAEVHLRRASKLAPENPEVQNAYAVFLCKQGSVSEALKAFDKAAMVPLYRTPEVAYTNAGVCARGAGRLNDADTYFRKALAVNKNYDEALLQLASLNFDRGEYFPARAFVERYLQTYKATAEVLWLGVRIEQAMSNNAAAAKYAERLLSGFPDAAETGLLLEQQRNGD